MQPMGLLALLAAGFLSSAPSPVPYVLSRVDDHRIVILGEGHWIRDDAELVAALVPELRRRNAALAMETLQASSQGDIDRLIRDETWDARLAAKVLRDAEWPYAQYRDILHAAWKAKLPVIALGPPLDFRDRKINYDAFMAERVTEYVRGGDDRRLVIYCGMHHAFTRYLQVERRRGGRATEFMDRMGNMLWRRFGEDVFLIALHKTQWCGPAGDEQTKDCLPFDGAIDCAASRPVGFDIAASPFAEMKFLPTNFYGPGHPLLRFIDYADGYVWTRPIDAVRMVDLIPLEEYAPEHAADPEWITRWERRAASLADPLARPSRAALREWRSSCAGARVSQ